MVNNQSYILCGMVPWELKQRRRWRERKRQKNGRFRLAKQSIQPVRIHLQKKKMPSIWQIERDGIIAIKFETARLHFLIDVFVAVTVFVA